MLHIPLKQLQSAILASGFVDEKTLSAAAEQAIHTNRDLASILIEEGALSEEYLYQILADYFKVPFVDLDKLDILPRILHILPQNIVKTFQVVPYKLKGTILSLAMTDPGNLVAIDWVEKETGFNVMPAIATRTSFKKTLVLYTKSITEEFDKIILENVKKVANQKAEAKLLAQDLPVITILDTIMEYALVSRASDIHIEMMEEEVLIRCRIDGILQDTIHLPGALHPALIARVKILAQLKIDEHRLPQDGRFTFKREDQEVSIRVSIIPTLKGEKAVLRLLMEAARPMNLEELGMSGKELEIVSHALKDPHGMILSTGPTGSGKTTTLYTMLHMLNQPEVNISTIEDPVEYDIRRINQIQVNEKTGLIFAEGLRSLLRQDPDILMVGEIRDKETAQMAVHAALTGHLLLSTLHTNDAAGAIPRLLDIGIEPYLLASTLNLIIAQRLVRRIHRDCIERITLSKQEQQKLAGQLAELTGGKVTPPSQIYRGKGCKGCGDTGYQGRIGIFEILPNLPELQELIVAHAPAEKIKQLLIKQGYRTLLEDGIRKIEAGITTLEEVLRVTRE